MMMNVNNWPIQLIRSVIMAALLGIGQPSLASVDRQIVFTTDILPSGKLRRFDGDGNALGIVDENQLFRRALLRDDGDVLVYEEDQFGAGRLARYTAEGGFVGYQFEVDPWIRTSNSQVENDVHGNVYVARFQSSGGYLLRRYSPDGRLTLEKLGVTNVKAIDADSSGRMLAVRSFGVNGSLLAILDNQGNVVEEYPIDFRFPSDATYDDARNQLFVASQFEGVATIDLNLSPPTIINTWPTAGVAFGISFDPSDELVMISGFAGTFRYTRDGQLVDAFNLNVETFDAISVTVPEPVTNCFLFVACLIYLLRRSRFLWVPVPQVALR